MNPSLREQLIQAGLATDKPRRQSARPHNERVNAQSAVRPPERASALNPVQVQRAAREEQRRRQEQEKAQRRARQAEVRQWVEASRIPRIEGDDYYNFIAGKKIKRIAVTAASREQLHRGELVIVRCDNRYELVPAAVAARVAERDTSAVIGPAASTAQGGDDAYSEYAVPDDLMW